MTWTEIGQLWTASYQRLWTFWILKLRKIKKIFSDLLQNFSNFFLKFRGFYEKHSCTKGLECVSTVQFSVQFYKNPSKLSISTKNYRKSSNLRPNSWNPNISKINLNNVRYLIYSKKKTTHMGCSYPSLKISLIRIFSIAFLLTSSESFAGFTSNSVL